MIAATPRCAYARVRPPGRQTELRTDMRFRSLTFAACIAALTCGVPQAPAQSFPTKPVRILVGAPPGGSNDIFARAIGQRISPALGQPVVVENRPGANQ